MPIWHLYMMSYSFTWMHFAVIQVVQEDGRHTAILQCSKFWCRFNVWPFVLLLQQEHEADQAVIVEPSETLSLIRLKVWMYEPTQRMKYLAILVDGCKGMVKSFPTSRHWLFLWKSILPLWMILKRGTNYRRNVKKLCDLNLSLQFKQLQWKHKYLQV